MIDITAMSERKNHIKIDWELRDLLTDDLEKVSINRYDEIFKQSTDSAN